MKRKPGPPSLCWARVLGGCAGGISREHIVSSSIFTGSTVTVNAALWNTGAPQVIGRNRLRRKILCREHNQALSPVDAEAGRTFKAVTELDNWLAASRKTQHEPRFHEVQGPLLERWFLKTTVNLFVLSGAGRTWADGARHDSPPGGLAEKTFGNCRLGYPLGLRRFAPRFESP